MLHAPTSLERYEGLRRAQACVLHTNGEEHAGTAELISSISDPRTVALIGGTADDDVSRLLETADNI